MVLDKMVALMRTKGVKARLIGKLARGTGTRDSCGSLCQQAKVTSTLEIYYHFDHWPGPCSGS